MNVRLDVWEMLADLGWQRKPGYVRVLSRGPVSWAMHGHRDSSMTRYDDATYTIQFAGDVPAHVIVATCEAAAKGARRVF